MKAEQYICPQCNCRSSGPVIENMVRCTVCQEWFPAVDAAPPVNAPRRFVPVKERVRWNAVAFGWVAAVFAAVAVLCLVIGLVQIVAQGEYLVELYIAGSAAVAAVLSFIISQVIHIRACLEK